MITVQKISISKRGRITIAEVAKSDNSKQALMALKYLESKTCGFIIYDGEFLTTYRLPKSSKFNNLQEFAAIYESQQLGDYTN